MADDIDDLLDEVEEKFLEKRKAHVDPKAKSKLVSNVGTANRFVCLTSVQTLTVRRLNLDDDINELLAEDHHVKEAYKKTMTKSRGEGRDDISVYKPESAKKCYPVFLGGSADPLGQGTSISHRTCNQLRCTSCDFKVCIFDNVKWSQDTTYLFLRNNVPDSGKLRAQLIASKGSRAYCCQCSWRTVTTLVELNDPELKWVCGKH